MVQRVVSRLRDLSMGVPSNSGPGENRCGRKKVRRWSWKGVSTSYTYKGEIPTIWGYGELLLSHPHKEDSSGRFNG